MTVLVRMTPEAIERLFTRDHAGNRLRVEWGEPDAEGFHEPVVSVDYSDNLVVAERERIRPYMATIKEALRIGAICFDGDSWYVSRDALGDHGYDLDDAEKVLGDARAAVLAIIASATTADTAPTPEHDAPHE